MTIQGAWICRACWKTNRPGDEKCYRCHTPRTTDDLPIQGERGVGQGPSQDTGRLLGILIALPPFVFKWVARLYVLGGILFLGIAVLAAVEPEAPALSWLLLTAVAAGWFLLGFVMRWASRAMRHQNPWAFVVALTISGGIGGLQLYLLGSFAPATARANPLNYVTIVIFGLTAILAMVGLLLSLAPDDGG
jgi:hypothetical protein